MLTRKAAHRVTDKLINLFSKPGVMVKYAYGITKTGNVLGIYNCLSDITQNKNDYCRVCLGGGVYKVAKDTKEAREYYSMLTSYTMDNYNTNIECFNDAPGINSSHLRNMLKKFKKAIPEYV